MNAKLAVALILTLQVSVSLCDHPTPSPELVQKYNQLRATFIQRLKNLMVRAQSSPAVKTEEGQQVMTLANTAAQDPRSMAFGKVAAALAEEFVPDVDVARNRMLGAYEAHLRPLVKVHVEDFITSMKAILDQYMPAQ